MKKFFYACAAILCLALAFHFGATNAQGQSGMRAVAIAHMPGNMVAIASNGDTYVRNGDTAWGWVPYGNIFGGAIGEAVDISIVSGAVTALASNGDFYEKSGDTGWGWQYRSNIFGAATSTDQKSWGDLKAKYR